MGSYGLDLSLDWWSNPHPAEVQINTLPVAPVYGQQTHDVSIHILPHCVDGQHVNWWVFFCYFFSPITEARSVCEAGWRMWFELCDLGG